MNNARYFAITEVARFEMMMRGGWLKLALKRKWMPLVVSQAIRYKRPLKRFQKFTLESRTVGWTDKWIFIEHVFLRKGKIMAYAMIKGCFRGPEGVIRPSDFFELTGNNPESPKVPQYFLDWEQAEIAQEQSVKLQLGAVRPTFDDSSPIKRS